MSNVLRQIGAGVNALSPTDFFVQINNTIQYGDIIDIYLPNTSLILDGNSIAYQYVGIRLSSLADVVVPPSPPTILEEPQLYAVQSSYTVNLIAQDGELINSVSKVTINVNSQPQFALFNVANANANGIDLKGTGLLIMLTGKGLWMTTPLITNNLT